MNQQQRKEWGEGKPGVAVMGSGQDMKQQNDQAGREYVMAYCVLQFIAGGQQIISRLVCNESAKLSEFVVVCGGAAAADDVRIANVFVTVLFTV